MVASATMAKELTVTYKSWNTFTNFVDNFKAAMAEAGINSYAEITHLKIITEPNATIETSIVTSTFDNDQVLFKLLTNLEVADFSETEFKNNLLPPASASHSNGFIAYNSHLKKVILPEGLTLISGTAFRQCTNLETVEIPNSVINIGEEAFRDCTKLKLDKLPANLQKIGANAFCANNGDSKMPGITMSELPEGVYIIGESAFNNTNVSFSKLPDGLLSLGNKAFRSTQVSFTYFPESIFDTSLNHSDPHVDTYLGTAAFVNCDGITEFTIPACVKSLPNQVFWPKTPKLERTFYCYATTPPKATMEPSTNAYQGTFGSVQNTTSGKDLSFITFYVLEDYVEKYEQTSPYSEMTIKPILKITDKEVTDFFQVENTGDVEGEDSMGGILIEEIVNGEPQTVTFDYERTYNLRFTPPSGTYISYIEVLDNAPIQMSARISEDQGDGKVHNLLYDSTESNPGWESMPVDVSVPLKADSQIKVITADAGVPLSVKSIDNDTDAEALSTVYNLQGICVLQGVNPDLKMLPAGIYVVKTGNSVRKVAVK